MEKPVTITVQRAVNSNDRFPASVEIVTFYLFQDITGNGGILP